MLRPRNPLSTSQLNQENAHHQSQHHLAAAKTPARQIGGAGPSKGLATGGLTARSGRVLGQKDGNKASKGPDGTERSGKGTAQLSLKPIASTSACTPLPQTRTPAPAAAPLLPSHLCTPSPGVRKFAALSFLSPEVEVEMEVENEVEEVNDEEREVEICGGSSADYDEPFDPGFKAEVFEGIGDRLRSMPLGGGGEGALSYEEWEESDRLEREQFKAELHFVEAPPGKVEPLLPLPKRRPLAPKSTTSSTSTTSTKPAFQARKPFGRSSTTPVLPLSAPAPATSATTTRAPLGSSVARPSTFSRTATTSTLAMSRPSTFARTASTSTLIHPTTAPRGFNLSSSTRLARPAPAPAATKTRDLPSSSSSTTTALKTLRPAQSTTSLRSTKSSSTSIMSRAEKEEARAKEEREAEEELGIFGVVDEEFRFEDEFAIEAEFEGQEEFRFDV